MFVALAGPRAGEYVGRDYPHEKRKAFDSQKEFKRWLTLRAAEVAGQISGLRRQVGFKLHAAGGVFVCRYYADFVYVERGQRVVEDVKGQRRRSGVYLLKKLWMKAEHGIDIKET